MRIDADWYVVCEGCGLRVLAQGETPVIPPHSFGGVTKWRVPNEGECIRLHQEWARKEDPDA